MKPFREEDLIAYHLHELSPRRARALERALQTDPVLAAESEAYAATLRSFKRDVPFDVDEETVERNWRALWPSLPAYRTNHVAPSRWRLAVLAGSAFAFAATSFFIATHRHEAPTPPQVASIRQPLKNSLATDSSIAPPQTEEEASTRQRERTTRPFSPSLIGGFQHGFQNRVQEAQPRRIASLPLADGPPAVLRLIPLAPVNRLTLPVPSSPAITMAPPSLAQADGPNSHAKTRRERFHVHHDYPADLTFAMGGTLIGTHELSSSGDVTRSLGATHAISAMAAFHQQLRPALGYRIAVSYTRPDFEYNYKTPATSGFGGNINGRIYELAATYVVQGPHHGSLSTTIEAGGGLMAILPTTQSADTSYNLRGAGVIGVAADFALTKHFGVHAAYRAQVFQGPDFNYSGATAPVLTTTLLSNEPTVGITYRFSHK